jgi:hypothetical protein
MCGGVTDPHQVLGDFLSLIQPTVGLCSRGTQNPAQVFGPRFNRPFRFTDDRTALVFHPTLRAFRHLRTSSRRLT